MQSLPQLKEYLETKSFRKGKEKFTYKNAGKSDIDRNKKHGKHLKENNPQNLQGY